MRIVADENITGSIIQQLRATGHDVLSVKETMRGANDPDVLSRAQAERKTGAELLFPFISGSATLSIFNAAPDDRLDFICEAIIPGHVPVAAPEVSTPILHLE